MSKYCAQCGSGLSDESAFCGNCGTRIETGPAVGPTVETPPAAGLLAYQAAPPGLPPSAAGYPPPAAGYPPPPGYPPRRPKKNTLWLVGAATAVVVVAVCVACYFLFLRGDGSEPVATAGASTSTTASVSTSTVSSAATTTTAQETAWEGGGASTTVVSNPVTSTTAAKTATTVEKKSIKVSMDFDSGTGIYTGDVSSAGVPHGQGSFFMKKSDTGKIWSYKGQWKNGEITGKGVMKQDDLVFTGGFKSGLLEGECEITDNGVLRYKGECKGGMLHGLGSLFTSTGVSLFIGEFKNDMLVETAAEREARGGTIKRLASDMDAAFYEGALAEDNVLGLPVKVWGFVIALGEQKANGTVVIGHMGENDYPVALAYRYGVDEPKMTKEDWINAWGVVSGLYEYQDGQGRTVTCPLVEVMYWDNEQEGL